MSWEGKECPPWGPEPQVRKCSSDSGTGRLSMGEGSVVFKDFLDMTNLEDSFHPSYTLILEEDLLWKRYPIRLDRTFPS